MSKNGENYFVSRYIIKGIKTYILSVVKSVAIAETEEGIPIFDIVGTTYKYNEHLFVRQG
jgi:hypothetical protein